MKIKTKIYLDYNIYDRIYKNNIDKKIFMNDDLKVFLSVAHVEEYYKAYKNDKNKKNSKKLNTIAHDMLLLTPCGVLNPGKAGIENRNEIMYDCLERVKNYDTRHIVSNNGKIVNSIQKKSVEAYLKNNKKVMNFSNLLTDEIWNEKEIKEELKKFPEYIKKYEITTFYEISKVYGKDVARQICNICYDGFKLKKNCYSKLKDNYLLLECVIEFLHNILGKCGYNRDNKERTSISGIHDVQHSIYATYCDYFISEDKAFSKRTNAIYSYLGIESKVINIFEFENIRKV